MKRTWTYVLKRRIKALKVKVNVRVRVEGFLGGDREKIKISYIKIGTNLGTVLGQRGRYSVDTGASASNQNFLFQQGNVSAEYDASFPFSGLLVRLFIRSAYSRSVSKSGFLGSSRV